MTLKVLDLFSGIGGFSLGLERTGGFDTVAFCEIEEFPRKVLRKHWPKVPIYDDVRTLTAAQLERDGISVDVICGGFPCQDLSVAGKRAGITGERSGLWSEIARLVGELRPKYVLVENVANLLSGPSEQRGGWFGRVLGDLAALGYDAEWHCIPASAVGAPHRRDRLWIIAYPKCQGWEGPFADIGPLVRSVEAHPVYSDTYADSGTALVRRFSGLRVGDGLSVGMERRRLHGCGNAVVPQIPEMIGNAILEMERAS